LIIMSYAAQQIKLVKTFLATCLYLHKSISMSSTAELRCFRCELLEHKFVHLVQPVAGIGHLEPRAESADIEPFRFCR
jgi:hypothetical protein